MNHYLAALPPYLGSKKSVARDIMRVIRDEGYGPGASIADAFLGGGGLAMAAKALGYRVHGNDISPISIALGKALIQNSRRRIEKVEMDICLTAQYGRATLPPPKELSLPDNCRRLLAGMVEAERRGPATLAKNEAGELVAVEGSISWLLRTWIAKTAITMATWGVPTMAAGRRGWDELTPGQAQQLNRTGRPLQIARRAAEALNRGVFDNGEQNTMRAGDAVEFLAEIHADIAYLDPPYPGTLSYEEVYVGVNRLLEPEADDTPSEWSDKDGWLLLERAFDAAEAIPLWVVSMGRGADPEKITEMMAERGREAEVRSLAHKHLPALKRTHDAEGDELLIVGKGKT